LALATLQVLAALILSGHLLETLLPAATVARQAVLSLRVKVTELRGPKTAGVLIIKLYGLKFAHVLGLGTLGTLDHLKFHRLFFGQGAKAFALDGAVMHKHIRTALPGDKAKALGVIEPFYRTSFLHGETSYRYCKDIPAKKAGRTAVRQKKIGG
jgi:hypothetical protein